MSAGRESASQESTAISTATAVPVGTERASHLGDFTIRPRVLKITALALVVGGASAVAAAFSSRGRSAWATTSSARC